MWSPWVQYWSMRIIKGRIENNLNMCRSPTSCWRLSHFWGVRIFYYIISFIIIIYIYIYVMQYVILLYIYYNIMYIYYCVYIYIIGYQDIPIIRPSWSDLVGHHLWPPCRTWRCPSARTKSCASCGFLRWSPWRLACNADPRPSMVGSMV